MRLNRKKVRHNATKIAMRNCHDSKVHDGANVIECRQTVPHTNFIAATLQDARYSDIFRLIITPGRRHALRTPAIMGPMCAFWTLGRHLWGWDGGLCVRRDTSEIGQWTLNAGLRTSLPDRWRFRHATPRQRT